MSIKIALAGNPNSGKTTLFNALTGSNQFVGNWPGVTVEKKEGKLKGRKDVIITDLPGIYSLSPYTLEEVVARNYLIDESPDVILNIVDGTNLERNLFLTTQIEELGIPVVVAINMMDVVRKNGDKINTARLSGELGCQVVEISALKGTGVIPAAETAVMAAGGAKTVPLHKFSGGVEHTLAHIEEAFLHDLPQERQRFFGIKLFERDAKIIEKLKLTPEQIAHIDGDIKRREEELADDSESIITAERYKYIDSIIRDCVTIKNRGRLSVSDKIDKVVTNRILGLPIFAFMMIGIYYVSVTTVGTWVTDFTNDMLVGEWLQAPLGARLSSVGTAEWLTGLIVDGIAGGVGAIIGFLPQMLIVFFFLAILEDCGYMARIAFIMDRIFRKFGMSGKSFIPLLIGTGCGVPGILAARTIEQEKDRRMTIMTTTFMPCGAKLPIIAMIAGALFGGVWWVAPSAYFIGMGSVIISGIILKKTKGFAGEPAPFIMELPAYHFPVVRNVGRSIFDRGAAFVRKAATVYMLTSILVWFAAIFGFSGGSFGLVDNLNDSVLHAVGSAASWIFAPLGFGQWQPTVATVMGLAAKEEIVGVFGVLTSIGDADLAFELVDAGNTAGLAPIAALFTGSMAAYSFLVFNLLCVPCFAAMNTIRQEMNNWKWTLAAFAYECGFAYVLSLIIFQLGMFFTGNGFGAGTAAGFIILAALLFLLCKPEARRIRTQKPDRKMPAAA